MAKRYILTLLTVLTLLLPLSGGAAGSHQEKHLREVENLTPSADTDESTAYVTETDLVVDLKSEAQQINIYDITGREVYKSGVQSAGRVYISRDHLPATPALLLVRVVDKEGNTKTFKVKL